MHGGVEHKLMLIHCGGVGRVNELHSIIKRQEVSGRSLCIR